MEEIERYKEEIEKIKKLMVEENLEEEKREEYANIQQDLEELVQLMSEQYEEESDNIATTSEQNLMKNNDEEEDDIDAEKNLIGSRCTVEFDHDKTLSSHSAIIMEIEEKQKKVRVLFSHPTCNSMKPCNHFLKSTCRFETNCRFSHGFLVDFTKISDYIEPNFEKIKVDCLVLTKSINDLWELGRISAIDGQEVAVKLLKSGQEISSSLATTVPVEDNENKNSELLKDTTSWPELKQETLGNISVGELGNWESEGGIGMKLLMKMGYKKGSGLGKNNDGIIHSIQPKICPKNASIDECIKRKRKVVDGKSDQNKKKKIIIKQEEVDIFAFINKKLEKKSDCLTMEEIRKEKQELAKIDNKTLGVKRIDLEIEIKNLKGKEKKLKDGILRNRGDKNTINRLKINLKEVEEKIEKAQKQQNRVGKEVDSRNIKKKDLF